MSFPLVVEIVVVAVVVVVVVVVVVIVVVVVVVVAAHAPDSSPTAEKVAMFLCRTSALLEMIFPLKILKKKLKIYST